MSVVDAGDLEEHRESIMPRPVAVGIQVMSDKIELAASGGAVVHPGVCRGPEHGGWARGKREAQEFELLFGPSFRVDEEAFLETA